MAPDEARQGQQTETALQGQVRRAREAALAEKHGTLPARRTREALEAGGKPKASGRVDWLEG